MVLKSICPSDPRNRASTNAHPGEPRHGVAAMLPVAPGRTHLADERGEGTRPRRLTNTPDGRFQACSGLAGFTGEESRERDRAEAEQHELQFARSAAFQGRSTQRPNGHPPGQCRFDQRAQRMDPEAATDRRPHLPGSPERGDGRPAPLAILHWTSQRRRPGSADGLPSSPACTGRSLLGKRAAHSPPEAESAPNGSSRALKTLHSFHQTIAPSPPCQFGESES